MRVSFSNGLAGTSTASAAGRTTSVVAEIRDALGRTSARRHEASSLAERRAASSVRPCAFGLELKKRRDRLPSLERFEFSGGDHCRSLRLFRESGDFKIHHHRRPADLKMHLPALYHERAVIQRERRVGGIPKRNSL